MPEFPPCCLLSLTWCKRMVGLVSCIPLDVGFQALSLYFGKIGGGMQMDLKTFSENQKQCVSFRQLPSYVLVPAMKTA